MDAPKSGRMNSVDILRGIAMVVMALDHVRDFFSGAHFNPLDLTKTTPYYFLTRWITHHCAPAFVFLAGTGAFLSLSRGKTPRELSWFLLTRGLWLVLMELTLIHVGWVFSVDYTLLWVQVIWAIGWSMVALSGLVLLPRWVVAVVAFGMIGLHNLTDGVSPDSLGIFGWPWQILHVQSPIFYAPGSVFIVAYPLIPWIGVMAAGYLFGSVLMQDEQKRRSDLYTIGFGLIGGFILIRAINIYGDMRPWAVQDSPLNTCLSFINTTKYPPSLLYLMMTLGPAIAILPLLERWKGFLAEFFLTFGRVPMFYYILHLYLIHTLAAIAAYGTLGDAGFMFAKEGFFGFPQVYGFSLTTVYLVWFAVIMVLYIPCRWFMGVKARNKSVWLSYL
jgi:uncharacterized membrane protein